MFSKFKYLTAALLEAAWPSGQRVGLAFRRSRVRVPLLPLAGDGFVLGRPKFKSSAKWLPPASLRFLILLCEI